MFPPFFRIMLTINKKRTPMSIFMVRVDIVLTPLNISSSSRSNGRVLAGPSGMQFTHEYTLLIIYMYRMMSTNPSRPNYGAG